MARLFSFGGKRAAPSPPYGKTAVRIAAAAVLLVLFLLNLFTFVFSVVRYNGSGMEPTLKNNQILLLRKTDAVKQGDIVAFYYNNKVLVRRVICAGGDLIDMDEAGVVRVNQELLPEPYLDHHSVGQTSITFPYNVSVGHFFVMGDNRETAMDSRLAEIGAVSQDRILGKVILIF